MLGLIVSDQGNHSGQIRFGRIDPPRQRALVGITLGDRVRWSLGEGASTVGIILIWGEER